MKKSGSEPSTRYCLIFPQPTFRPLSSCSLILLGKSTAVCILFFFHLRFFASVAAQVEVNKMGPLNLGVVFGPTLMRPDDESAGHIQNIAFQNCVGKSRCREVRVN